MGNLFSAFSAAKKAPRCTYTTSRRCLGERRSGGPFWEVLSIVYTYGNCRCSLEVSQKGIAKRVDRVCVALLDKDDGTNVVVDADVVVTADTSRARAAPAPSASTTMTIRSCNLAPHKGILENWSQSFNSVDAIRYFTPTRQGVFSLTTPIPNNINNPSTGTIRHYFETKDSDGAGFAVEVKFKLEASKGLCVNVKGPKLTPNISFTDHIEVFKPQGDSGDSGPVIRTSLPAPEAQDGHGRLASSKASDSSHKIDPPPQTQPQFGGTLPPNPINFQHSDVQPVNHTSLPNAQDGPHPSSGGPKPFDLPSKIDPPPQTQPQYGGTPNPTTTQPSQPVNHASLPKAQGGRSASSLAALGREGFDLIDQYYGPSQNRYPYRDQLMDSGATKINSRDSSLAAVGRDGFDLLGQYCKPGPQSRYSYGGGSTDSVATAISPKEAVQRFGGFQITYMEKRI